MAALQMWSRRLLAVLCLCGLTLRIVQSAFLPVRSDHGSGSQGRQTRQSGEGLAGFVLTGSDVDCPGNDLKQEDMTLHACAEACRAEEACVGFTFSTNKRTTLPCALKHTLCNSPEAYSDTVIYRKPVGTPSGFRLVKTDGDCPGYDLGSDFLTVDGCAAMCAEKDNCAGFVYSTNALASAPCWFKQQLCDSPVHLEHTSVFAKTDDEEVCFVGGPLKSLNMDAGAWMNVFVTLDFKCDGTIAAWEFYASRTGVFNVGVWRPEGNRLRLIGKNRLEAKATGKAGTAIAEADRISVQTGDVIGIHYNRGVNEFDGGVVPYEDSRTDSLCCGLSSEDLHSIYNSNARDEDLTLGTTIDISGVGSVVKRVPALTAIYATSNGPTPVVTSSGGSGTCGQPAIPPDADHRIVGGVPAVAHSWPWQVSLQRSDGRHFCGGSLINQQWVVSAAHCQWMWLGRSAEDRKVVVGAHDVGQVSLAQRELYAVEMIPHAEYNRRNNLNDIMLLKLSEPVQFTDEISPICLPNPGEQFKDALSCFATGWGRVEHRGATSDVLLQVEVPIIETGVCNQVDWYNGQVFESMLCAGYERGNKDACQGDSGGPLACTAGDTWKLTGVVSWGYRCGEAKKPGVYQKTERFLDWIKQITSEYS